MFRRAGEQELIADLSGPVINTILASTFLSYLIVTAHNLVHNVHAKTTIIYLTLIRINNYGRLPK